MNQWVDDSGTDRVIGGQAGSLLSSFMVDRRPAFATRGDANGDHVVQLGDVVSSLMLLFGVGTPGQAENAFFGCPDKLDANDDGLIDIADPLFLLRFLFGEGIAPPPPFGECGQDETPDSLLECTLVYCFEECHGEMIGCVVGACLHEPEAHRVSVELASVGGL